jgi:hypothetical protein
MTSLWWGDAYEQNKMYWFASWRMCIPKRMGGMGFRYLHSTNPAMLVKQCWRLIQNLDSHCACVLRAKYYLHEDLLKARIKSGSSYTWQSIVVGLQTYKRAHIW